MAAINPTSTVDLSRLPPPTIVEQQTFDQIRDRMIARLKVVLPDFDATVASDPVMKLLDVAAYILMLERQAFNDAARQLIVAYATGGALDHLAALVGVVRLQIAHADAATGAAAVFEDDASLRQRIVLAPEGFSVAGPELAYVKFAKDAGGDVLDASATSPQPGDVLVTVLSRVGDGTPSPELLDAVRAIVTDKAVRPLGDRVTVAAVELVSFEVVAALTTFSGPDVALVLTAARAALDAYFAENRLLGRDINRAGIIAALKVPGVENVALASPVTDVVCTLTQAAQLTGITVTHTGYAQ